MVTSHSSRSAGGNNRNTQIEGSLLLQLHILHLLTLNSFQNSNDSQSFDDDLNLSPSPRPSALPSNNYSNNSNTTPTAKTKLHHVSSPNDAITPTQSSNGESSNSTPKARNNLDCFVRPDESNLEIIATTASARYEQALRLDHEEGISTSSSSNRGVENEMKWTNVWASLMNGEIMIWRDRSSSISSPVFPLCSIPLSGFNQFQTSDPSGKTGWFEITLFSSSSNSTRTASYGSVSGGHPQPQVQPSQAVSRQSPNLEQESTSSFPWPRSMSRGSLMKSSSSSRTLADALRFGNSSIDAPASDHNKKGLSHSQSQSTLTGEVKQNRKEKGSGAWSKIFPRSRRLKSLVSASASSDSLSDQLSLNGSITSSYHHGGDSTVSQEGNGRDRANSISSSPLARSIALPSPGFSSSSHSTAATSISLSPTTPSYHKMKLPSKISILLPSAESMNQWVEAIKIVSKTSPRPERCQTSPTNGSGKSRPPLSSIPGFSPPPLPSRANDAYNQASSNRILHQQPISPTLLPHHQRGRTGRSALSPSRSESILMIQATSESKLSQRRKDRADAVRAQTDLSQTQPTWNVSFTPNETGEDPTGHTKPSRLPKKQNSVPVVSSTGPLSLKTSSSKTSLSARLMGGGRKRVREEVVRANVSENFSNNETALHRQVQNCRASIKIPTGNSRGFGKGEFYRPSTSSGASLKSFGSGSISASEKVQKKEVEKTGRKRASRPISAAGYEHVQARNSFTLSSGLTHAQNLAKQYLAGQKEGTPSSPVLSSASCSTSSTAVSTSEPSEHGSSGVPFLRELANLRTNSPLAKEAMLPELSTLSIPSRDGQGRLKATSPQIRSSSPLGNQTGFTPNSITQSLYSPSEAGESAFDRFTRVREGSSQAQHGLGLEGIDHSSDGHGNGSNFISQRSWSKSPSFAASPEFNSASLSSTWSAPQGKSRQKVLRRLKATTSRGSLDSNREEELEEKDQNPGRRSSLTGSALGISLHSSLALPSKSSSPSLSNGLNNSSNALGLTRSPSLRGLATKLLRPSSASGIASSLQFTSSRNSSSDPRTSRDSESSFYGGRASSGDTSTTGRSLDFDNEVDIDDYEMIPSPRIIPPSASLPVINLPSDANPKSLKDQELNLNRNSKPTVMTTNFVGNGNENSTLGRKTKRTAEKWVNRLGSSPRMNNNLGAKSSAGFNNDEISASSQIQEAMARKQGSSFSSSSPPIVERILPPEQIISILDNLRENNSQDPESRAAAAAREALFRSSNEKHQNQIPHRRSPKPTPRNRLSRPRTGPSPTNISPSKQFQRDMNSDQRYHPQSSTIPNRRKALGTIQSSVSEQSGLSLPPPPRMMSKRPSAKSLAATLENGEEKEEVESQISSSSIHTTPSSKIKKLSRSTSEIGISASGSTPIQDIDSAFPSPIRRSRRNVDTMDKENNAGIEFGRKRSNSTSSFQSLEDQENEGSPNGRLGSQEVLLDPNAYSHGNDFGISNFSQLESSNNNWSTFGNYSKSLTSSNTSNTFLDVKVNGNSNSNSNFNSHSHIFGDESFGTTSTNSFSSPLEGSQEAVLHSVTGKSVFSQL